MRATESPRGQVGGERRRKASQPGCAADQPQPALGEAIRQLRQKRRLTQEDLAHEADITTGTLPLIEHGQAYPTWGTVKAMPLPWASRWES